MLRPWRLYLRRLTFELWRKCKEQRPRLSQSTDMFPLDSQRTLEVLPLPHYPESGHGANSLSRDSDRDSQTSLVPVAPSGSLGRTPRRVLALSGSAPSATGSIFLSLVNKTSRYLDSLTCPREGQPPFSSPETLDAVQLNTHWAPTHPVLQKPENDFGDILSIRFSMSHDDNVLPNHPSHPVQAVDWPPARMQL